MWKMSKMKDQSWQKEKLGELAIAVNRIIIAQTSVVSNAECWVDWTEFFQRQHRKNLVIDFGVRVIKQNNS